MSDMRIVVAGAAGRMGRALVAAISETEGLALAGAFERAGAPEIGRDAGVLAGIGELGVAVGDDPEALLAEADGVLDFTVPDATVALSGLAAAAGIVHVIGTTGLSKADLAKIEAAGERAVIIRSGNMSLGVNLLVALTRTVARALDADFDIEIAEMHHRHKIDAPSGTALMLGEAAAEGRGVSLEGHQTRARDGHTGPRRHGDIGFAVMRGGSVVGEHSVVFAGPGERVELVHRAGDRTIFARGAVKAALWGRGRESGVYSMADVLGLND